MECLIPGISRRPVTLDCRVCGVKYKKPRKVEGNHVMKKCKNQTEDFLIDP